MIENQTIQWSAFEYEEKNKGNDWFWALGVIVVASAITSFIYENYFFAIFLVIGGLLLAFFAIKKPDLLTYELNAKGLKIKNNLFPYETIKSFFVEQEGETDPATLFIKFDRVFMPIISIPIERDMAEEVRYFLFEKNILGEEMKEHVSEKIMDFLGF